MFPGHVTGLNPWTTNLKKYLSLTELIHPLKTIEKTRPTEGS